MGLIKNEDRSVDTNHEYFIVDKILYKHLFSFFFVVIFFVTVLVYSCLSEINFKFVFSFYYLFVLVVTYIQFSMAQSIRKIQLRKEGKVNFPGLIKSSFGKILFFGSLRFFLNWIFTIFNIFSQSRDKKLRSSKNLANYLIIFIFTMISFIFAELSNNALNRLIKIGIPVLAFWPNLSIKEVLVKSDVSYKNYVLSVNNKLSDLIIIVETIFVIMALIFIPIFETYGIVVTLQMKVAVVGIVISVLYLQSIVLTPSYCLFLCSQDSFLSQKEV